MVTTTNVSAADMQTYTQQFQNSTTTLSGRSVESNMYLTKMDYWDVKKVTFNFNFQVSQLATRDMSDITVSLNGVKFYSFRPSKKTGTQSKTITVPVKLLGGSNKLQIEGQILSSDNNDNYQLAQTPANWLTIEKGSNVNFEYDLKDADDTIDSFYDHFSGQDTISYARSRIATANDPTPYELTASMIALAGESRVITTVNDQIPVVKMDKINSSDGDYVMVIAKYNHLASEFKKQISSEEINGRGVIKTYYNGGKRYLIVTANTGSLLKKAARFVANAELMKESTQSTEYITDSTATFTSSLHDNGVKTLTSSIDTITGAGHRESDYLVSLPNDRTNADGSEVYLKFRYSKNLNFHRSLVTIKINGTTLGSKKLSSVRADNDTLTVKVPRGLDLGNSFTVSVGFDLEMEDQNSSDNSQTPWAEVDTQSKMYVKSKRSNDLLFSNYPTLFINNQTYDNIAVVAPNKLSDDDFKTLTNVFNLIGNFSKSNTGNIQFYSKMPSKNVLKNKNVIVIGTPKNNAMIKSLNSKLYFKYSKNFSRIISNEKLSIEHNYGKTIGTAQLLRSPYNDKRGMLVVTGANDNAVYLASTQINFQANIQQYSGDGIVVDTNNTHYGYRFKKNKAIDKSLTTKQLISNNTQLIIYLVLALVAIIIIGAAVFLVMRKQGLMSGGHKHGK
ncbi:cellulose biosynthesis cyclic di-GMP-binding regulatory protein BcsB [Companilactobacillus allii]|uniref:Cellulose synthase n=1 Tax=Companilactobacillus allii TaxID=1847728 RepID=A0A1P8Q6D4_9LACO|nr:cellulose biosynthesis cyclic di-GMP-binding regulatory protein BcsB [Companilactobacillus allii]APX73417.1 cellulose synthase [Companilactobacillus allii]USQ69888.1 cellulose biosynthesis cyclic di-GMP-binding regulatory protein BcsB [Companilactobacillus allii]